MGLSATLKFRKFKVALNPENRIFYTLLKFASNSAHQNSMIENGSLRAY